jgi:endoglucanase
MLLPIIAAIATLLTAGSAQPDASRPTPPPLSRGINISHWFWIPADPSPEYRRAYITAADVAQLKSLGLDHARIPVEPGLIWDHEAGRFREEFLADYRRGLSLFTDAGLTVIVDPHPARTPWAEAKDQDLWETDFGAFWAALAANLADTDPARVVLEVINEPHDIRDPAAWPRRQVVIIGTIRAAAPRHTIIATGDGWGSIDGVLRLEPLADPNVIYSFHFYDPHTFTHQGAAWGAPNWKHLRDIPYPVSPEIAAPLLPNLAEESARNELRWYADQRWDRAKVAARFAEAAAWADKHNARVYCGEFGVYREFSPAADRGRWLADTVAALGEHGIGWAMWDYAGGFGLFEGPPGKRTVREDTAKALGLP